MIIAEGNASAVGISYRTGGNAITQASIAPESSLSIQLPAGVAPDFQVTTAPAGQQCLLSVDWQFQVMPRSQTLRLNCEDRFALPDTLAAYPLQWIAFDGVALDSIAADLRIEFTRSGNTQDLPLVVTETQLLFSVPDGASGSATITLWQGSEKIADIATTISSTPTIDIDTFVDDWFANQFNTMEQDLTPSAFTQWNSTHNSQLANFRQQYDALSDADKLLVARTLWVNVTTLNDTLNTSSAELNQSRSLLISKTTGLACSGAIAKLLLVTSAGAFLTVNSVQVGAAMVAASGPAAPVVIVGAGILTAALTRKTAIEAHRLSRKALGTCARYVLTFAPDDYVYTPESRNLRQNLLSKTSGTDPIVTRSLNLVHGQPYSTKLLAQRELPPLLENAIRNTQTMFQPVSGFFGDSLDWLFLLDFKPVMPLNTTAQFALVAEGISATTLSLDSSSALSIELALTANPVPTRPTPFEISANATVRDTWLEEDVPVEVAIDGHLSGLAPVAFDVTYDVNPGETIQFTLPTEFATTTSISSAPTLGTLTAASAVGEYIYSAGETEEEQDSFIYVASNYVGSTQAQVTINLRPNCSFYGDAWNCLYEFHNDDRHLRVVIDMGNNQAPAAGQCHENRRVMSIEYYEKTGNEVEDSANSVNYSAWATFKRCSDHTEEHTAIYRSSLPIGASLLTTWKQLNGSMVTSAYESYLNASYGGADGRFNEGQTCSNHDNTPASNRYDNFVVHGAPSPTYHRSDYTDSFAYCPRVTAAKLVPFSPQFVVNSASAYRHAVSVLRMQGITVK